MPALGDGGARVAMVSPAMAPSREGQAGAAAALRLPPPGAWPSTGMAALLNSGLWCMRWGL